MPKGSNKTWLVVGLVLIALVVVPRFLPAKAAPSSPGIFYYGPDADPFTGKYVEHDDPNPEGVYSPEVTKAMAGASDTDLGAMARDLFPR